MYLVLFANYVENYSSYVNSSTYAGYGVQKLQGSLTTPSGASGHQTGKETVNDVTNTNVSTSSAQLGSSAGLQSNSGKYLFHCLLFVVAKTMQI